MTIALALGILGLALLDSTTLGTLLIPLWLLLMPGRVRWARAMAYLLTLAAAYCAAGILVALGADRALDAVEGALEGVSPAALMTAQLLLGLLLAGGGAALLVHARRRRTGTGAAGSSTAEFGTAELIRWRDRAMDADTSGGLIRLALLAFVLEFTGMVPYLAAIGMLTRTTLSWPGVTGWIAVYCAVMVLPAALATVVRVCAHDRVEPVLVRLDAWLQRNSVAVTGIAFVLIGLLVTAGAVSGAMR